MNFLLIPEQADQGSPAGFSSSKTITANGAAWRLYLPDNDDWTDSVHFVGANAADKASSWLWLQGDDAEQAGAAQRPPLRLAASRPFQRSIVPELDEAGAGVRVFRAWEGGETVYWARTGDRVATSSSAGLLARYLGLAGRLDHAWLARFFALQVDFPTGATPFSEVRELRPGELLTDDGHTIELRRNTLDLSLPCRPERDSDWVDQFLARLEHAVASVLPPEGRVGVMLSGGLDSGPMTAQATSMLGPDSVEAFSWSLAGQPEADEWAWIASLARYLQIRLHKVEGEDYLPFSRLDATQIDIDTPIFNAFRPLVMACYQAARSHGYRVLLNAASGDDLYPVPNLALLDALMHRDWRQVARLLPRILRRQPLTRLHQSPSIRSLARHVLTKTPGSGKPPAWLGSEAQAAWCKVELWPPELKNCRHPDHARRLFGPSASRGLAGEQRFSGRFGISRRDPYLNLDLRRLMLNAPHSLSWRGDQTKWIMREAMRGRLPEAFRTKPRTGLLNSFFHTGFERHRESVRELLFDNRALWQPWIRPDFLEPILNGTQNPERGRLVAAYCLGFVLWREKLESYPGP